MEIGIVDSRMEISPDRDHKIKRLKPQERKNLFNGLVDCIRELTLTKERTDLQSGPKLCSITEEEVNVILLEHTV